MFSGAWHCLRLSALEAHDLALSKLERNLDRDRDDVQQLARAGHLKSEILRERYYSELRPNLMAHQARHEMTLHTEQQVDVKAAICDVFKGVLHRLGEGNTRPDGQSLQMVVEQWPGGRWFRDLGNGTGHLWGHVQVVKAPVLLELSGPMFMSYPALNHVEVKLLEIPGGTKVTIRHRALGFLDETHRQNIGGGWKYLLDTV